jgi:DNA-binding GntR family transcriptional regulator
MRRVRSPHKPLVELKPTLAGPPLVADRVYVALKHRILTGAVPPGRRIIERDVAGGLDASRTPVREALNRLALEGLVHLKPYCGYVVTSLDLGSFRQLCEMRSIVEGEGAALAAARATPADIARLRRLTAPAAGAASRRSHARVLRANALFHLALVKCARNQFLETAVMAALDQIQRPLHLTLNMGISHSVERAEHLAIVHAVGARDGKRARRLMHRHLERAAAVAINALQAGGLLT